MHNNGETTTYMMIVGEFFLTMNGCNTKHGLAAIVNYVVKHMKRELCTEFCSDESFNS